MNLPTYWRVTFKTANGRSRHVWAYKLTETDKTVRFFIVNREGDEPEPREMVFATSADILRKRVAAFNNKYAELEVVPS